MRTPFWKTRNPYAIVGTVANPWWRRTSPPCATHEAGTDGYGTVPWSNGAAAFERSAGTSRFDATEEPTTHVDNGHVPERATA